MDYRRILALPASLFDRMQYAMLLLIAAAAADDDDDIVLLLLRDAANQVCFGQKRKIKMTS